MAEEDKGAAYGVDALDAVGNEIVTFREAPLQLPVAVVEIPVATPCALTPPKDLLTLVEQVIVEKTDVEMRLADLADDERDPARGNVELAKIKRIDTTAATREEQPVAGISIIELDVGILERTDRQELSFAAVCIVPEQLELPDVFLVGQRHFLCPKDRAVTAQAVDDVQFANL